MRAERASRSLRVLRVAWETWPVSVLAGHKSHFPCHGGVEPRGRTEGLASHKFAQLQLLPRIRVIYYDQWWRGN